MAGTDFTSLVSLTLDRFILHMFVACSHFQISTNPFQILLTYRMSKLILLIVRNCDEYETRQNCQNLLVIEKQIINNLHIQISRITLWRHVMSSEYKPELRLKKPHGWLLLLAQADGERKSISLIHCLVMFWSVLVPLSVFLHCAW
jgi:hypothetical protein